MTLSYTPVGGSKQVIPASVLTGFAYDSSTNTAIAAYTGLPEGNYTLKLLSNSTGFRDRRGNLLDGSPSFPTALGRWHHLRQRRLHRQLPSRCYHYQSGCLLADGHNLWPGCPSDLYRRDQRRGRCGSVHLYGGCRAEKLSIRLTPLTTLASPVQARIELLAPDGTSLGTLDAAGAGQDGAVAECRRSGGCRNVHAEGDGLGGGRVPMRARSSSIPPSRPNRIPAPTTTFAPPPRAWTAA